MPNPLPSELMVDPLLTQVALKWLQDPGRFVATRVFPIVPVEMQGGKYATYQREFFYRTAMAKRGLSAESQGTRYGVSTDNTYYCEVWAEHKDIDDAERANAQAPFNPDRDATDLLMQHALIAIEREWASRYFVTGVWATEWQGVAANPTGTQFLQFDQAGSSPIDVVLEALDAVEQSTGYRPNAMVVGADVHRKLRTNAQIREHFKYTNAGAVTDRQLADLFEVDRYLVPRGVQNTAADGATASYSRIVDPKSVLLVYAPPRPSTQVPSGGYTFVWRGLTGANDLGARISRFRMQHLRSDRIEAELAFDMKLVAPDLGIFLRSAVA